MEWVLEIRHPALTPIFLALTFLGDVTFFLVVLPLGYWIGRREVFFRLVLLLVVTALLNASLKELFQVPRPAIHPLVEVGGWSFPSGHAQIAGAMWAYLAWESRRLWLRFGCVLLILGIAASRVYLGVHRPVDVLVGATVGVVTVALAQLWLAEAPAFWSDRSIPAKALGIVAAVAVWTAFLPGGGPIVAGGVVVGFWIGALYERAHVGYVRSQSWWRRIAAGVLGLAVVFGLRAALKLAFAALAFPDLAAYLLRYALIGAWIGLFAPWLFRGLGLAGEKGESP